MDQRLQSKDVARCLVTLCSVAWISNSGAASPPGEAHVTRAVNDVRLVGSDAVPRRASVNDNANACSTLRTGRDSRAELTFADQTVSPTLRITPGLAAMAAPRAPLRATEQPHTPCQRRRRLMMLLLGSHPVAALRAQIPMLRAFPPQMRPHWARFMLDLVGPADFNLKGISGPAAAQQLQISRSKFHWQARAGAVENGATLLPPAGRRPVPQSMLAARRSCFPCSMRLLPILSERSQFRLRRTPPSPEIPVGAIPAVA
jgi:hypothetical protein